MSRQDSIAAPPEASGELRIPSFTALLGRRAWVLLRHPSLAAICQGLRGRGWVGEVIHAHATAPELDLEDAAGSLGAYLRLSQGRLDTGTHEGPPAMAARRRLLRAQCLLAFQEG